MAETEMMTGFRSRVEAVWVTPDRVGDTTGDQGDRGDTGQGTEGTPGTGTEVTQGRDRAGRDTEQGQRCHGGQREVAGTHGVEAGTEVTGTDAVMSLYSRDIRQNRGHHRGWRGHWGQVLIVPCSAEP